MVTRVVSNNSELITAFAASAAGDVIECTAGANLGSWSPSTTYFSGSPLVIRSQDPNNRAYLTYFRITNGAGNIRFEDILFDYTFSGEAETYAPFSMSSAVDCHYLRCEFNGDTDGSPYFYQSGQGVQIYYGSGHTFEECKITTFTTLMLVFESHDFTLLNSELTDNSGDALDLVSCDNALVRGNHFHGNAYPAYGWHNIATAAHVDCIQLQRNLGGCNGVQILENVFDYETGTWGQCIWAGDDGADVSPGSQFRHSSVTIRDNIFYNGHTYGYGLSSVDGLTIDHNTMLEGRTPNANVSAYHDARGNFVFQGAPASPCPKATIGGSCTGVIFTNNITAEHSPNFPFQPGWTVSNNYEVPLAQHGTTVTVLADGVSHGYHDYQLESGNAAHTGLAGSRMTKRVGGWGGQEITPPSTYQGGVSGVTPLPVLPAGSVAATVTVP
jgi:hypothetical protein